MAVVLGVQARGTSHADEAGAGSEPERLLVSADHRGAAILEAVGRPRGSATGDHDGRCFASDPRAVAAEALVDIVHSYLT